MYNMYSQFTDEERVAMRKEIAEIEKLEKQYKEEQAKFRKEVAITTQDTTIPYEKRLKYAIEKLEEWEKQKTGKWSWAKKDFYNDWEPPETFGPFKVSRWGGVGGYGFELWIDKDGSRQKRWIDILKMFNIVHAVKKPKWPFGDEDDTETKTILESLHNSERGPHCLSKLFPNGYYLSQDAKEKAPVIAAPVASAPVAAPVASAPVAGPVASAPVTTTPVTTTAPVAEAVEGAAEGAAEEPVAVTTEGAAEEPQAKLDVETNPVQNIPVETAPGAAAAAGGAYRKTRRNRKTKRTNKRKSKRANKKTNKRRCKKTKKHKKK